MKTQTDFEKLTSTVEHLEEVRKELDKMSLQVSNDITRLKHELCRKKRKVVKVTQ